MAARMLQKRISSVLLGNQPHLSHVVKEKSVPSAYSIFSTFQLGKRDIQTETRPTDFTNEDPKFENHEDDTLKLSCDSDDQPSESSPGGFQLGKRDILTETESAFKPSYEYSLYENEEEALSESEDEDDSTPRKLVDIKINAEYNLKLSPRHDLCIVFTCSVCETRTMKTASRESYEKGVVVARCSGCSNYHLMADNLGLFGEKCTVEDFLAARGEKVKKGHSDTLNLTMEDFAGMDLAAISAKEVGKT
ncbi:uncharacterized protein LOC126802623 [Argentina anserina]|uniref:uncharacterized protein LOC126802623 n=1 Tax=Argentina anserina TaxID=57926 RepID=UPI002176784A|nr:uncharacterized protein LOC126802623 [Potentilla anserina]